MLIYKILPRPLWIEAEAAGALAGAAVDLADGFIHFSTGHQVRDTARLHFAGQADLLLLAVEANTLGPALRWEPSRGGASFPHLFRPLGSTEMLWVRALPLGADGRHVFPDDLA